MNQENPYRPPPAEAIDPALDEQEKPFHRRAAKAFLPGFAVMAFFSGFYIISNSYGDPYSAYVGLGFLLSPILMYIVAATMK